MFIFGNFYTQYIMLYTKVKTKNFSIVIIRTYLEGIFSHTKQCLFSFVFNNYFEIYQLYTDFSGFPIPGNVTLNFNVNQVDF
jgi:hypothetical protein